MDRYIWSLYKGELIYQKRKNGLFYNGRTHKKLDPQPSLEEHMRNFYKKEDHHGTFRS